jgi:cadmium resistance protein CadD (predicted permease)
VVIARYTLLSDPTSSHVLVKTLSLAGVAAISYVSTNFDNLVFLLAYGAKPGYKLLLVNLTFLLVCIVVLVASLALALAANTLPAERIRYLGLVPIGVGCYHLVKLVAGRVGAKILGLNEGPGPIGFSAYLGFALVLLANSGDTLSVMTPILAGLQPVFVFACFAAALAMAIFLTALAGSLARYPKSKPYLEKLHKWVLPFLLIGIGVLILTDTRVEMFVT